jgi:hypothetical protein
VFASLRYAVAGTSFTFAMVDGDVKRVELTDFY